MISIPKYTEGGGHGNIFIAALFSYYCKQLKSSSIRKQLNNVAQSVYGINEVKEISRVGNGNPLQYSCLENPRIEEPGGLESVGPQRQTQLSD